VAHHPNTHINNSADTNAIMPKISTNKIARMTANKDPQVPGAGRRYPMPNTVAIVELIWS
jgi:hypothetical protein